jgi:hypothetical protein
MSLEASDDFVSLLARARARLFSIQRRGAFLQRAVCTKANVNESRIDGDMDWTLMVMKTP